MLNQISGSVLWGALDVARIGFIDQTITWGSGINQDSITISAIPEPSSTILLGLGALSFFARRRRTN